MPYSNHASLAFASSTLQALSELVTGLEQGIKDEGEIPHQGYDVGTLADGVRPGCIPSLTCHLRVDTLEDILQEAANLTNAVVSEVLKLTAQAKSLGISEFDTRFITLLGPAPDRRIS